MRRWSEWVPLAEIILGATSLILAVPVSQLFDQPRVVFDYEGVYVREVEKSETGSTPVAVQMFRFENITAHHNIEQLNYAFRVPGKPVQFLLLKGSKSLVEPKWDDTEIETGQLGLSIKTLPPQAEITGLIAYEVQNGSPAQMPIPDASASELSPAHLTVDENDANQEWLQWVIIIGVGLVAIALITWPYIRLVAQIKYLRSKLESHNGQDSPSLRLFDEYETIGTAIDQFVNRPFNTMYWFRMPIGIICNREGFDRYLGQALDNPNISKIRIVLDSQSPGFETWQQRVVPLISQWMERNRIEPEIRRLDGDCGTEYLIGNPESPRKVLAWIEIESGDDDPPPFVLGSVKSEDLETTSTEALAVVASELRQIRDNGEQFSVGAPKVILQVEDETSLIEELKSAVLRRAPMF